jgi:hypothetical protein
MASTALAATLVADKPATPKKDTKPSSGSKASTAKKVTVPVKDRVPAATPAVQRDGASREWLERNIGRGVNKVITERISVTPQMAMIMLERNTDNRPIYPSKLDQLVSDMNAGRFKLNGETIIFAKTGELNDGQHRLHAIVRTNKPQDMLVAFGVERETRNTVDTGKARSAGDHLAMTGWPYAMQIASVTRIVLAYEKNGGERLGRTGDISVTAVQQRAVSDALLQECSSYAGQHAHKFRAYAPAKVIGLCFYIFAKKRPLEAKTFMEKFLNGTDLSENSPIKYLRDYLLMRPKLTYTDRIEIVIRCWNAWIKDKTFSRIQLQAKFPKVEG